eukprot:Skav212130  [mRNA]  locus=scaffold1323:71720:77297:+ [translate_table: standard]
MESRSATVGAAVGANAEGSIREKGHGRRHESDDSPMWVVKVEHVLAMTGQIRPHQILMAEGLLEKWDPKMFTIFASHQWLGWHHPDPNGAKLRVLQGRPLVLVAAGVVLLIIVVVIVLVSIVSVADLSSLVVLVCRGDSENTLEVAELLLESRANINQADSPLMEAGMDSLSSVQLVTEVSKEFAMSLSPSLVFDFPNVSVGTQVAGRRSGGG